MTMRKDHSNDKAGSTVARTQAHKQGLADEAFATARAAAEASGPTGATGAGGSSGATSNLPPAQPRPLNRPLEHPRTPRPFEQAAPASEAVPVEQSTDETQPNAKGGFWPWQKPKTTDDA
jgi:hypothetical protein